MNVTRRTRRKVSGFFGQIGKKCTRTFGSFSSPFSSTPRRRPVSMVPSLEEVKQEQSGDGRCSVDNGLAFENEAEFVGSHPNQLKSSSSSPVFRVPVAPPRRNRTVRCSTVSLDTGVNACSRPNR